MKLISTLTLLLSPYLLHASSNGLGLIGGKINSTGAYAALISPTGEITSLNNLPPPYSNIQTVALNSSGMGLIAGSTTFNNMSDAYAALIKTNGEFMTLLDEAVDPSLISDVAINSSGYGILGGYQMGIVDPYGALVSPEGVLTHLNVTLPGAGVISCVAINDKGLGLIAGSQNDLNDAYAAFVSPEGVVAPISGLPTGNSSVINEVRVNNSGLSLLGGIQNTADPYVAYAIPTDGIITDLSSDFDPGTVITNVALNSDGTGLVGGYISGNPYYSAVAALVTPNDSTVMIAGLPANNGKINDIAINDAGLGLVGGYNNVVSMNSDAYAAYISPSGEVSPISGLPTGGGSINSVALANSGAGLIGGYQGTTAQTNYAYAALVTPAGRVIPLSLPSSMGLIMSVKLMLTQIPTIGLQGNSKQFADYINTYSPDTAYYFLPAFWDGSLVDAIESALPTRNAISLYVANSNLFYLNHTLSTHLRNSFRLRANAISSLPPIAPQVTEAGLSENQLTAALSRSEVAWGRRPSSQIEPPPPPPPEPTPPPPPKEHSYTLWLDGVGAFSYQKPQQQTVGYDPVTGALILGLDRQIGEQGKVGVGIAYSCTHVHEKESAGHSTIYQEYLFGYATYAPNAFYLDVALWGGLFQIDQVRHIHLTGFDFAAGSHPKGHQLSPHLEMGYLVVEKTKFTVDPFIMLDWVNSWQHRYEEKGGEPFNIEQKEHHASILRSELGVRLYETFTFNAWRLTFLEKGSYVNIKPFEVGKVNAFLAGTPASFTVETLTADQNLAAFEFGMIFTPMNPNYPYGSVNYQGELGSSSQSHQINLELAWKF